MQKLIINKAIVVIMVILGSFQSINAQEKGSSEIKIGYGVATSNELVGFFTELLEYSATLGTVSSKNQEYSGTVYMAYKYAIIDDFSVGLDLAYERGTKDVYAGKEMLGEQTDHTFMFAVRGDYSYISTPMFRLYSGVGVGCSVVNQKFKVKKSQNEKLKDDDDFTESFNFHVTGLGFRVGNQLALHAELGFGYQGIVSAGISYQF